jgi:hypothetical protein
LVLKNKKQKDSLLCRSSHPLRKTSYVSIDKFCRKAPSLIIKGISIGSLVTNRRGVAHKKKRLKDSLKIEIDRNIILPEIISEIK